MKVNSAVAFKGTFDSSFPTTGDDRMPGRSLGELIVQGLNHHGLEASGPLNEEPFFVAPCRSGAIEYRVLCYILEPGDDPVWVVECPRTLGRIANWRGKTEQQELGAVVTAIHETLRNDSRVREMRWFPELPASPFDEIQYDSAPTSPC